MAGCSCPSGTTLFTSPYWYAYSADIDSPNSNISLAFFYELIDRMSCTPGVEQNNPHLTPGVLNNECWVAINKSHVKAICSPAAAAIPSTAHRVMMGSDFSLSRVLVHC